MYHRLYTLGAILLTGGIKMLAADTYPSVASVAEISELYLKTPEAVLTHKEQAKAAFRSGMREFLALPEKTPDGVILQAWDGLVAHIEYAMSRFQLLGMVEPKDVLREAYQAAYQDLNEDYIAVLSDAAAVYQVFSHLAEKAKKEGTLSHKEQYYLETILEHMRLEGLHLPDDQREQVKHLKIELAALSKAFSQNIQEDQSSIKVSIEELGGMDSHFVNQLTPEEGQHYVLTCDYPTYYSVMRSCQHEGTRKNLYRAFSNRAYPHNVAVLEQMIAKRDELAKLLGFASFTHYQLSNEMVKDPAAAEEFLERLFHNSVKKRQDELAAFKEVLPKLSYASSGKIFPWDMLYAQQRVKEARYQLNQEEIQEYFPLETTIDGLIWLFENFLNLNVMTESISGLWHEDVKLLKISDKSTQKMYGYILLDLFPRPNKYSHACHGTVIPGLDLENGKATTSLSIVIANFPKPSPTRPSLLPLSDVKTFFHELGHAMHAVMGRTQFAGTSGTHVKVDFVELPSQMLEEWLYEPEVLKKISCHYQTKKSLPDEWITRIQSTRGFGSGQFIGGQCFLSKLALECFAAGAGKNTNHIVQKLHGAMDLHYVYDPETHMQASFGHLDEYGARYYGYLWSRVFAADVFEQIKKEGLLNPKAGARYVQVILKQGGSEDPAVLLKEYLGREPSQEAFLHLYDIK